MALSPTGGTAFDLRKAALAGVVVLIATAFAGATQHGPALLLRALVVVTCIWLWPREPPRFLRRDCIAPGVALAVIGLGLFLAPVTGFALSSVITVGLVCALFFALVAQERHDLWPGIARVATAVAVVHAVWAIVQWLAGATRGSGGFFNPNDLAAFSAPLVVFVIGHGIRLARARDRSAWLPLSAGVVLVLGLVASGSRGGLLAAAIGGVIVAFGAAGKRPVLKVGIATAIAVVGVTLLVAYWGRWSGRDDPYGTARLDIWQRTAEVALAHPLGIGLGHYREAMRFEGVPVAGPVRFPKLALHAHNEPLHAWAELGWLGLLATLLPVGWVAYRLLREKGRAESPPGLDWGIFAAFALPAALSASLHVPPVAFLAAAWAAHVSKRDTNDGATVPGPRSRAWVTAPLVLLLLLAVPGAIGSHATLLAAEKRDTGDLEGAREWARIATISAPWSLGAALTRESLEYLAGKPPPLVVEALEELAERFPHSPKPLDRAALVLEQTARGSADATALWPAVVALRTQSVARDPHNAVGFYRLAMAQVAAGLSQEAEVTLRATIRIEPKMARALARLAERANGRGETGRARALATAAREADQLSGSAERGYPFTVLSLGPETRDVLDKLELGETP